MNQIGQSKSDSKVIDSIWFNQIGIVKVQNEIGEIEYYIGKAAGFKKKADEQHIKDWGMPVSLGRIEEFMKIKNENNQG